MRLREFSLEHEKLDPLSTFRKASAFELEANAVEHGEMVWGIDKSHLDTQDGVQAGNVLPLPHCRESLRQPPSPLPQPGDRVPNMTGTISRTESETTEAPKPPLPPSPL